MKPTDLFQALYGSTVLDSAKRMNHFTQQLDAAGKLDLQTGAVTLDERAIEAATAEFLPDRELASRASDDLRAIARKGFAMLDSPKGAKHVKPSGLPWASLEMLLASGSPVGHALLEDELLKPGRPSVDKARKHLQKRFRNVPESFLAPASMEKLIDSALLPREPSGGWGGELGSPLQPPSSPSVSQWIECFRNGHIDVRWYGLEFCLNHGCAEKLASVLVPGTGTGDAIATALKYVGVASGAAALAGTALTLYAIALSLNIWAVNGPRGACIVMNWPTPFLGMFVFARPR